MSHLRTVGTAALIVGGALLACKKKEEPPPAPVVTAAPAPTPTAEPPKEPEKKKDEVTRYGDKETTESGTVRVTVALAKVYKEADASTDFIATLGRGTMVNRKVSYGGTWMLIDYPSGIGELSPGWVAGNQLTTIVEKIDPTAVAKQDAGVTVVAKTDAGAPPATSGSAKPVASGTPPATSASGTPPAVSGRPPIDKTSKLKPPDTKPTATGTGTGSKGVPPPPGGRPKPGSK